MAVVHRVLDTESGRHVALKRLRAPSGTGNGDGNRESAIALFEREYLTLAQLAHPRIVEAYDYGVDEEGPYYTMELLDGGDLQGLAPVPWKEACVLARDVCSALALLHSRRMVYRDLSPRNVRCTSDGTAKLIDFGAMTTIGPSRELVGTPPYVAPEALNSQPLDARTDLYALGATLYFTLVQRHAYPARDLSQLRDLWRSRPRRPSEIVADIPEALDNLVMDLMHLDPAVRPASAAEVMARLAAIAGVRSSEQLLVTQAYLSNPTLVGRSAQLTAVRKLTWRTLHRRGASIVVRGAPGIGRSRFLDACVLEAKLAGLTVVRLDASDGQSKAFGAARALARQLLQSQRALAMECAKPHAAALAQILPELGENLGEPAAANAPHGENGKETPPADRQGQQRGTQAALHQWVLQIARKRSLMIAADDFSQLDEPSAAFLALLAQEVGEHGIMVVAAVVTRADQSARNRNARELLESASTPFELDALTLEDTELLLDSVFGDVPNVALLASYLQRVTAGNPRDIMQLAQHLVNEDVIRYFAGTWSVPARLSEAALPSSMGEALRTRVAKLSASAATLALVLALEPTQRFTFEECATLGRARNARQLAQTLDELTAGEIVATVGQRYGLRQQAWVAPLLEARSEEQLAAGHSALAALFEARGEDFRAAQHLLRCGEDAHGLDLLVLHAVESRQRTDASARAFFELAYSLPRDWLDTYEAALELCDRLGRPAKDCASLLARMDGLISNMTSECSGYHLIQRRLNELERQSGLDIYAQLPDSLEPGVRLRQALGAAQARYEKLPERERVAAPADAIKQIVQTYLSALGTLAYTHDYEAFKKLPALAPLALLSPSIALVERLAQGVGVRIRGRYEEAHEVYEAILERMAQADRAGLDDGTIGATRVRVELSLATMDAAIGRASALEVVSRIERSQAHALQGMLARYMYYVWQGDTAEAARCKRRAEVLQLESNAPGTVGQNLFSELCAYALTDDMTRVKRTTDAIEAYAKPHRAWQPVLHYGRAEYQRIRGDCSAALREVELALSLMVPGEHMIWPSAAGARVRVLNELGRFEDALAVGETYLAAAVESGLGYVRNYIALPLSLSLSKLGRHDEAAELAQRAIEHFERLGATGLNLAAAFEARARVALESEDQATFEHYAKLCAKQWPAGEKRLMGAKYQRGGETREPGDELLNELSMMSQFTSTLENCQDSGHRAQCGIEYLGRQSGAGAGLLYTLTKSGLVLAGKFGDGDSDEEIEEFATEYFDRELDREEGTEAHSNPPPFTAATEAKGLARRGFIPVLLTHQTDRGNAVTGLALLTAAPGAAFTYPSRVATELSRILADSGDAITAYT
jgi:tRNA A-37 threonylcarbamoyl transferase component Bud32